MGHEFSSGFLEGALTHSWRSLFRGGGDCLDILPHAGACWFRLFDFNHCGGDSQLLWGMWDAGEVQRGNGAAPTRLTLKGGFGAFGYAFYALCPVEGPKPV